MPFATRKNIIVSIAIGVALLHFVVGKDYYGPWRVFVASYLIDICLPFMMYLLLGITNVAVLESPVVRGLLVFGFGAAVETMQLFGIHLLGSVFDPVDYAMYAMGVVAAFIFERFVRHVLPETTNG